MLIFDWLIHQIKVYINKNEPIIIIFIVNFCKNKYLSLKKIGGVCHNCGGDNDSQYCLPPRGGRYFSVSNPKSSLEQQIKRLGLEEPPPKRRQPVPMASYTSLRYEPANMIKYIESLPTGTAVCNHIIEVVERTHLKMI